MMSRSRLNRKEVTVKLRDYFAERRIIREDRRRISCMFAADFQFSRMFDDTWCRRRRMTKAGWKKG